MGEDEISEEIAKELASVEVQGSKVTEEVIEKTVDTEESILGTEEGVGKVMIASGSEESDEANATLSNGQVSTNDRVKVEAGEPLDRSSESDERIEEGSIKSEESMMTVEATFAGDAGEAPEEVEEDIIVPVDAAITGPGGDAVEEVKEEIIVPVDATFTGNEAPEPEAPAAPEEPEAEEPEEEPEIGDTGASTGGVDSLRAQGLSLAAVASFLALLL